MYREFKWISEISERCPSFKSYIATWVDLQDIIAERCGGKSLQTSLTASLKAMQIEDRHPDSYFAANEAVRCLAVLSGLISMDSFDVPLGSFPIPSELHSITAFPKGGSVVHVEKDFLQLISLPLTAESFLQSTRHRTL